MTDTETFEFQRRFCGEGQGSHPARLGIRFDQEGNFLREPGNTIVCHVFPDSPTQAAMIKVRDRLQALDTGNHFIWTPVSSYHMTLFNGVIDSEREASHWPEALSLDAPIPQVTAYHLPRLANFRGMSPFAVKLEKVTPLGLLVSGATDDDEVTIRRIRDDLTLPFGYRKPDHEQYALHLTMAYITDWLPQQQIATYISELARMTEDFRREVPVLELGPAEFCLFDDMNHFEPVLTLS